MKLHENIIRITYKDIRNTEVTFREGDIYFDGVKQLNMVEGDLVIEWRPLEQPSPKPETNYTVEPLSPWRGSNER